MNCERICTPVPSGTVAAKRLPFYSHDGLGLGHVRRNIAIAKTRFCGYVSRPGASEPGVNAPPEDTCRHARPVVLATAGGGEDGFHMLRAFIDVAGGMPWQAVLVSGPCAPQEECKVLRAAAAEAGIAFHRFIPGLATWLPDVDVLVCMGGHNTLVEALAASVPTVCVPRTAPRQEQLIRARAFRRLGLLQIIEPARLEPRTLHAEIMRALAIPRSDVRARVRASLPMGGARAAAAELLELHDRSRAAAAVAALA